MSATATKSPADRTRDKLRNTLGAARGEAIISSTMRAAGLRSMESADDRYRFGSELTKAGGLLEAIGRSIMVQALLQGAKGPEAESALLATGATSR